MAKATQHRLLQVLAGQSIGRPPIWMMRQAGRYLPEYRAIRAKVPDFMSLCRNTSLAVEVTLQPLQRFKLDAAILFSDILTIPDAMGLGLRFEANFGPVFDRPVQTQQDILSLSNDVTADLGYVFDAVSGIKQALNHTLPLIGFSGSPWTLAAYMIQGHGRSDFAKPLQWVQANMAGLDDLLTCLTKNIIAYCFAQIQAGADVIMLFDSHGGQLPPKYYTKYSLQYLRQIIQAIQKQFPTIPIIVYGKVNTVYTMALAQIGATCVGVSHLADLMHLRNTLPNTVILQGNIDPTLLNKPPNAQLESAISHCLQAHANQPGIINLGHGIQPEAHIASVHQLIDTIHAAYPTELAPDK